MNETHDCENGTLLTRLRRMANAALAADPVTAHPSVPAGSAGPAAAPSGEAQPDGAAAFDPFGTEEAAVLLDRALGRLAEDGRYIP